MEKPKKVKEDRPSYVQKAVGVLVIVLSVGLGLYLMDRFPGVQVNWRKGEGPPPESVTPNEDFELAFVKDWTFQTGTQFQNYEVGGLSSLTYDAKRNLIISLSDDRGGKGPSRFFEWEISFDGQVELNLKAVRVLKDENKKVFPERTIDPEGVAWLDSNKILISSEGEQEATPHQPPRLFLALLNGEWSAEIPVSNVFWDKTKGDDYGVRNNMAFEALTIDPSSRWIYLGTESALHQDGPVADFDHGSTIRIAEYDRDGEGITEVAQLPYVIEPIPGSARDRGFQVGLNGVSDFLALGQRTLLVMERAYLANRGANINRLYLANCIHATDVKDFDSLKDKEFETCKKKLVFEFDSILNRLNSGSTRIDNLEGMVLWQDPNSQKHYVLFVSDNNFRKEQSIQFILFELKNWNFNL